MAHASGVLVAFELLDPLTGLVPPPLVDLLLSHEEVFLIGSSQLFDGFSSPETILPKFLSKQLQLALSLSLAFLAFTRIVTRYFS